MMHLDEETLRFIFGIKLRSLRSKKSLSLKELSKASGLSPSYLNEIEKGKKYPKADKIIVLSKVLGIDFVELTSLELEQEMRTISKLLQGNLFQEIPFEIFGLPSSSIFELIAKYPNEMSGFFGTFLELARMYDIRVEDFFDSGLRNYLDHHRNIFPEIERAVDDFVQKNSISSDPESCFKDLKDKILPQLGINFEFKDFSKGSSEFNHLYFVRVGDCKIVLNDKLSTREVNFILGREIGFKILNLKPKSLTSETKSVDSFDEFLDNFKASYFSGALLVRRHKLCSQLEAWFSQKEFKGQDWIDIVQSYPGTFESVFHRTSQVLPQHFEIDRLYLLRMDFNPLSSKYNMSHELHLSALHAPHANRAGESYCRRWVTTRISQDRKNQRIVADGQVSKFYQSENTYFNLSISHPAEINPVHSKNVTLGIQLNKNVKDKIKFLGANNFEIVTVGSTCERCSLQSCEERIKPCIKELAYNDEDYQSRLKKFINEMTLA